MTESVIAIKEVVDAIDSSLKEGFYLTDELDKLAYINSAHTCYTKGLPKPFIVVLPRSTEEVQKIVQIANKFKIPVVPWGVGSGSARASEPVEGCILIDMRQMNKILEIDLDAMTVTAQAGATLYQIEREIEKYGLTLGDNSQSRIVSTIGGRISTAGLPNDTLGYGPAEDQFLALTVVLPTGEVVKVGSKNYKSSSAYNLVRLFAGAEGTLGIITEATLKVYDKPDVHETRAFAFKNLNDFIYCLRKLFKSFAKPCHMMVYDRQYWTFFGFELSDEFEWVATFSFKGDEDVVRFLMDKARRIMGEKGVEQPFETAETLRKAIYEYFRNTAILLPMERGGRGYVVIDPNVPLYKLEELRSYIFERAKYYGFDVIGGYFHVTHMPVGIAYKAMIMREVDDYDDQKRFERFLDDIVQKTLSLGGTLSSFRGVGKYLAKYFHLEHKDAMPLIKKIKKALDPNLIMNPDTKVLREVIEE